MPAGYRQRKANLSAGLAKLRAGSIVLQSVRFEWNPPPGNQAEQNQGQQAGQETCVEGIQSFRVEKVPGQVGRRPGQGCHGSGQRCHGPGEEHCPQQGKKDCASPQTHG